MTRYIQISVLLYIHTLGRRVTRRYNEGRVFFRFGGRMMVANCAGEGKVGGIRALGIEINY